MMMTSPAKRLIINADDLGYSAAINDAVKICYIEGSITGASIMPSGMGFRNAADMLKKIGRTDIGVHLTLTGSLAPCSGNKDQIATLLDINGLFVSNHNALGLKLLFGKIKDEEIYIEFKAQIEKVLKEGLVITHLDSHEHVHMFPVVFKQVLRLAREYKVPYVRVSFESASVITKDFSIRDLARYSLLRGISVIPRKLISGTDIVSNDFFFGHFHSGRVNEDVLFFMLENVKNGLTELAVHPAVYSKDFVSEFPWYKNAEDELDVLLQGKWKKKAEELGITLVSHRQAVER
jgi:predicted glycoside hydrolase/deacetylase ChbG (UPF0249 family)